MKHDDVSCKRRPCSQNNLDLFGLLALALSVHRAPIECREALFLSSPTPLIAAGSSCYRHRTPLGFLSSPLIEKLPLVAAISSRYRCRSPLLVLSPREQYALQQKRTRERLEAARAPVSEDAPPSEDALKWRAEAKEYAQRHADPLTVFNDHMFPPSKYEERNGLSREDGYWAFLSQGLDPPSDSTYGEFPLFFFGKLVDRACELAGVANNRHSTVLADLGSGAGRLALWAASTSAWKQVVGIEYLPKLAAESKTKLEEIRKAFPQLLLTKDVQLIEGSWDDPLDVFANIDIAFAYTTALTTNDGVLVNLSSALRQRLNRGCIVVTTDYALDPADFEVLEKIDGENAGVGGTSTGFIHRKISSSERDIVPADDTRVEVSDGRIRQLPLDDDQFHTMEALLLSALRQQFPEDEQPV